MAQFGPFADAVDSGRLLSPIVSITPSEPVAINTEAAAKGLGTTTVAATPAEDVAALHVYCVCF